MQQGTPQADAVAQAAQSAIKVSPVGAVLTYNGDGTLNTVTTPRGVKTMVYSGGKLVGITGTGLYPASKTLNYSSGKLTSITIP